MKKLIIATIITLHSLPALALMTPYQQQMLQQQQQQTQIMQDQQHQQFMQQQADEQRRILEQQRQIIANAPYNHLPQQQYKEPAQFDQGMTPGGPGNPNQLLGE